MMTPLESGEHRAHVGCPLIADLVGSLLTVAFHALYRHVWRMRICPVRRQGKHGANRTSSQSGIAQLDHQ